MWEIQNPIKTQSLPRRCSEKFGTVPVKTNYRSYRDYLQSFNESRRDDQESLSSTDSGISGISSYKLSESKSANSSSCSVSSDLSTNSQIIRNVGVKPYKEFLENYSTKKFSPVKPTLPEKKNVKSEIYIEIVDRLSDSNSNGSVSPKEIKAHKKLPPNGIVAEAEKPNTDETLFKRPNGVSTGRTVETIKKFNDLSKKDVNVTAGKTAKNRSKPDVVPERSSFINGRTSPFAAAQEDNKSPKLPNGGKPMVLTKSQTLPNDYRSKILTKQSDSLPVKTNAKIEDQTDCSVAEINQRKNSLQNGSSKFSANVWQISEELNKINARLLLNGNTNKINGHQQNAEKETSLSSSESLSCSSSNEFLNHDEALETKFDIPAIKVDSPQDFAVPPPPPPPLPPPMLQAAGSIKPLTCPKKWGPVKTESEQTQTSSAKPKETTNQAAMDLAKVLIEGTRKLRKTKSFGDDLETNNNHQESPESLTDRYQPTITTTTSTHITNNGGGISSSRTPSPPTKKFDAQPLKSSIYNNNIQSNVKQRRVPVNQSTLRRTMSGSKIENSSTSILEANAKTVIPVADRNVKIEKTDPNVKKMVYNTYRGLLGAYNPKANGIIATLPRNMVREDQGVTRQLESIASSAPPPPPGPVGALPSTRLQSEIGPRGSEPPLVVQNAMMTKDKKPFTYTPGGIDLTEIRSPRMARRLEKNAASEGVQLNPHAMQNQPSGPLPPSALSAMQSAMPVQVFPNGQVPQLGKGGAPPPPPPLNNAGPPPPPPMQANKQANRKSAVSPIPQNYERPDMTKIIPENPMALLRKSPGPVVKQDPILNRENYVSSGLNPLGNQAPQEHLSSQQPQSPEIVKPMPQIGTAYSPPVAQSQNNVTSPPATLRKQPQQSFENRVQTPPSQPSPPPFVVQRQRTQNQQSPDIPTKVKSPPPPLQRQPTSPESPGSPKVNLNKAPTPWLSQKAQQKDVPPWAVHEQNNEPFNYGGPTQQPSTQLPGGARIVPVQQQQSPVLPGGARIVPSTQLAGGARIIPNQPEVQQKFVSNHNVNSSNRPIQDFGSPQYNNVVVVNEPPTVFQGPGRDQRTVYQPGRPQQQQQSPKADSSGARIIPIQIEGTSNPPSVQKQQRPYVQKISGAPPPIENRPAYNRQQSQSNSFKVLQKMTNTDVDVDDEPAIDCSPRSAQQFQQQRHVPADQMRQMKLNDGDQEFVNRFKQGDEQNASLHNEVDPRYRGAAIPSKAFKLLQNMTDSTDGHPVPSSVHTQPINRVHQQPQAQSQPRYQNQNQNQSQSQARERTIPIQIEGNNGPKKYVPPSEQKVPEPKKYTGSAIPSRSFKILQAMTAPENCADPEPDSENYTNDPSSYEQWGPSSNNPFPYYYPYGPDIGYGRRNCVTPTVELRRKKKISKTSNRRRSFPYSPSMENEYASEYESDTNSSVFRGSIPMRDFDIEQDFREHSSSLPRGTPVPFWPFYPPQPFNPEYCYEDGEDPHHKPYQQYAAPYPPVWDPYTYYAYYYGTYPPPLRGRMPAFSPYMFPPTPMADGEDISGYSSADETVTCSSKQPPTRPPSVMRGRSETPNSKIIIPTYKESVNNVITTNEQNRLNSSPAKMNEATVSKHSRKDSAETLNSSTSDSSDDLDTSCDSDEERNYRINPLSTIPSVANVQVYNVEEQSENEEDTECANNEDDRSSVCCIGEAHLLSTIDELSERTDITDSKINKDQTCISDDEATAVHSEESDNEDNSVCEVLVTVNIPLKVKHTVSNNRNESLVTTVGNSEIIEEFSSQVEHTNELFTSFTLRSPSRERTPGKSTVQSEATPEGNDVNVRQEFVKQDSVVSCENESTDTDAVVKVVSVETRTVTEKVTISPTNNHEELKQEKTSTDSEEEIDWWGKISSEDTEQKKSSEKVVAPLEIENVQSPSESDDIPSPPQPDYVLSHPKREDAPSEIEYVLSQKEDVLSEGKDVEDMKRVPIDDSTEDPQEVDALIYNTSHEEETKDEEEVDFWAEIIASNDDGVSYRRNNSKVDSPEEEEQNLESQTEPPAVVVVLEHSVNSSSISSCNGSVERNNDDIIIPESDGPQKIESPKDLPEVKCDSLTESSSTFATQIENASECEEESKIEEEKLEGPMYIATTTVTQTNDTKNTENEEIQEFVPLSIKERIKALENARRASSKQKCDEDQEIKISVKDKVSVFEENNFLLSVENFSSKRSSVSGKNSIKSFEECSEVEDEEIDSGVTSDISKHVSEHEAEQDFPNLKKMNKYQRASTHSRLFKLLQDEIEAEDEAERLASESNTSDYLYINRDHLDLPLKTNPADSESGINSPASPVVNEGLVNELVQSLLMKKQAKIFKKMPMEKLQAAAVKILKEDVDVFQQSPDEVVNFLSPATNCTADSTAIHTPQEFYSNAAEYMEYYNSWGDPDHSCDFSYDILPSKAFKFIQEHTATNKTGSITGFTIKCPRVLSSKNILNDPSTVPQNHPPQQNEAASAS